MRLQRTRSRDPRLVHSDLNSQRESKPHSSTSDSPSPPPLPPRRKGNLTSPNSPTPSMIVLSPSPNILHSNPSTGPQRISMVPNAEPQPDNGMDRNCIPQGSVSVPNPPSPPPLCSQLTISQSTLSPTKNSPSISIHDAPGRSALLANIRLSGGVGALRKVVPF